MISFISITPVFRIFFHKRNCLSREKEKEESLLARSLFGFDNFLDDFNTFV